MEIGLLNMPIALTLAAGLLAAGMPITVKRKEVRPCGSGPAMPASIIAHCTLLPRSCVDCRPLLSQSTCPCCHVPVYLSHPSTPCPGGRPGGSLPHRQGHSAAQLLAARAGENILFMCPCACPWPPRPSVCLPAAQQCALLGLNRVLSHQTGQVELDASLQREGRGLKLQFNRIDGVLRLREDD